MTSSSFGAPTIGVKADCAFLKRSLATSVVVIAAVGFYQWQEQHERREVAQWRVQGPCGGDCGSGGVEGSELLMTVEVRHVTVKLLLLIYGSLDGQALKVGKPISSSARC